MRSLLAACAAIAVFAIPAAPPVPAPAMKHLLAWVREIDLVDEMYFNAIRWTLGFVPGDAIPQHSGTLET